MIMLPNVMFLLIVFGTLMLIFIYASLNNLNKRIKEIENELFLIRHIGLIHLKDEKYREFRKRNEREFK